jgi:hypothetical protein
MSMELSPLIAAATRHLPLPTVTLTDDYYYQSLPLCVIDAVYSIGVRYEGVRRVVARYCEHTHQPRVRASRLQLPPEADQESITLFCERFQKLGLENMTVQIFANRQRTSARNGILKADAVHRFATTLQTFGVEYLQDVSKIQTNPGFESAIHSIPGQRSGISLQYFWMLTGSEDFIKPDRIVIRFLESALNRSVTVAEAPTLLREASRQLSISYPQITPRLLDYAIWQHQRTQA